MSAPSIELDGLESHQRDRKLAKDQGRNRLIVEEAARLVMQGRQTLVLVKLVSHAHALAEAMAQRNISAESLVGAVSPTNRRLILGKLQTGAVQVVVATSLADEGLDIPSLDAVVLAAPTGNMSRIEQRVGRALRPHPDGQTPVIVDVVDSWGPFQGYARRRGRFYDAKGWR